MGKRSSFERVERDYYRTFDPRAMESLAPHLEPQTLFIEPCAGAGDLVDQLTALGHLCWAAWDIAPQRSDIILADALEGEAVEGATFITNPPWSRPILHKLITHLSDQAPTWMLFDTDWFHTVQAAPFMPRLRKYVSAGRLKWIPGTTMSGKDNCAWYLFCRPAEIGASAYGRVAA